MPWRIHELTRDFRLEDVWALPTPGGPGDFPRRVHEAASLGVVEAFERQSRDLAALAAFGVGLTGAGLVAHVGGILNALVSQRTAARKPRCDRERKC